MKKFISSTLCCVLVSGVLNAQFSNVSNTSESTNENRPMKEVSIYPNPSTQGVLNISGLDQYKDSSPLSVSIFNLNGKIVLNETISNQSGITELAIDQLLEGEYTLRIETKNQLFRSRLIVTD